MKTLLLLFAIAVLSVIATAQEKEGQSFEVEFVASDVFRSGSAVVPVARRLAVEGHYFGGTNTDTGFAGASWQFRLKELKLMPGFGAVFGSNQFTPSPAFLFRWEYEKKWFITQGLVIQSFRSTPIFEDAENEHGDPEPVNFVRPSISDGNHVSVRWNRATIGGTWEHIEFREGSEWKGGGRLALRILPHVSGILYVLAPGRTEWRGGILIHARQE